jgi:hypothetical protein
MIPMRSNVQVVLRRPVYYGPRQSDSFFGVLATSASKKTSVSGWLLPPKAIPHLPLRSFSFMPARFSRFSFPQLDYSNSN